MRLTQEFSFNSWSSIPTPILWPVHSPIFPATILLGTGACLPTHHYLWLTLVLFLLNFGLFAAPLLFHRFQECALLLVWRSYLFDQLMCLFWPDKRGWFLVLWYLHPWLSFKLYPLTPQPPWNLLEKVFELPGPQVSVQNFNHTIPFFPIKKFLSTYGLGSC